MSDIQTRYIAKPKLKEILSQEKYKHKYRSQKEFALAVGVKDPTISRFDTQTRYDINTLISISKELEMNVEDLFNIEENPDYVSVENVQQVMIDVNAMIDLYELLLKKSKDIIEGLDNEKIATGNSRLDIEREKMIDNFKNMVNSIKGVDIDLSKFKNGKTPIIIEQTDKPSTVKLDFTKQAHPKKDEQLELPFVAKSPTDYPKVD